MSEAGVASGALEPGMVLDRYELLCAIARGGMANVWLGRLRGKHGFERLVAIKTILPEYALDAAFQRMFLDEARIISGIDHPNVAKTLDLGEQHDALYLVMEYVDGDSFSRTRKQAERAGKALPLELSMRVLSETCAGLHAAHELRGKDGVSLGVVHRDVSPQNVLVGSNGAVKVIDFGIAKARDRLAEETGAGFAKGKSRYMAPEAATQMSVDRRADVFAVGAMAYEMLEGACPYDGPNDMARLHALMNGPEVRHLQTKPPAAIEALIVRALARDPDKRFQTCAEMRAAIEDAMVASKLRGTTDDLAAFVLANTKPRIEERQRIVTVALEAARGREEFKNAVDIGAAPSAPEVGGLETPPARPRSVDTSEGVATTALERDRSPRRSVAVIVASVVVGVAVMIGVVALAARRKPEVVESLPGASATVTATATATATVTATVTPTATSSAVATAVVASSSAPRPAVSTTKPRPATTGSAKRPPRKHDDDQIQ